MRMVRGLLAVLLLLLLSQPCFAAGPTPSGVVLPSLGLEFLGLVALLSVAVLSIAAMAGESLQSPQISAWTKEQLREVVAGTILAVLIWGSIAGSTSLISLYFGADSFSDLGNAALQDHLDYMEMLYLKLADAYQTVGLFQGFSYFASVGIVWIYLGQGGSPYYGASVLLGPLANAANSLTLQILSFRLIKVIGYYVEGVFPDLILPGALALRIFPFTRKAGNTLIAISLGVMVIMPLSLLFVNEFWHATTWTYKEQVTDTSFQYDKMSLGGVMDAVTSTVEVLCGNEFLRTIFGLGEFGLGLIFATIACIPSLPYGYFACWPAMFWEFVMVLWHLFASLIYLAIGGLVLTVFAFDFAAEVAPGLKVIPEILLPAVAEATGFSIIAMFTMIMITFSGIKAVSTALGGEYVLYGVSRFV